MINTSIPVTYDCLLLARAIVMLNITMVTTTKPTSNLNTCMVAFENEAVLAHSGLSSVTCVGGFDLSNFLPATGDESVSKY